MSKTYLRMRPIYNRLRSRLEAYICLSLVANTIYKELEMVLKKEQYCLSVEIAAEITRNMYQVEILLPESKHTKNILLKMVELQEQLIQITNKNYYKWPKAENRISLAPVMYVIQLNNCRLKIIKPN